MKIESITGRQIAAARVLLKLFQWELAERSKVSIATLKRMESCDGHPDFCLINNVSAVCMALRKSGITFVAQTTVAGAGVRLRKPQG